MAARSHLFRRPLVLSRRALRRVRAKLSAGLRNRAVRERSAAAAAFALIAAVLVGSVDYLITGGPDWNPGAAEAAQIAPTPALIAAPVAPAPAPDPVGAAPRFALEAVDYSVATETLLGGPTDYAAVYEPDEARLYRQINAMYAHDTVSAEDTPKPVSDADLERYYFGATTEPDPPKS